MNHTSQNRYRISGHIVPRAFLSTSALGLLLLSAGLQADRALAADLNPSPREKPAPDVAEAWADKVKFGFLVEGGIVANPNAAVNGLQFGSLLTDRANVPTLNQLLLSLERLIDPTSKDYDFGFSFQALYGSDARYLHFLGELDRSISERNQLAIINANVSLHAPVLTPGGVDLKVGQFISPIGYEALDPFLSPFYSHSYIFNFGVPILHTGGYAVMHVNETLDLYGGVDSGLSTGIGYGLGDNNKSAAGIFGFGLNGLLDGKMNILALTHAGAETPLRADPAADRYRRYVNDLVVTYKGSDALSFALEGNYLLDTTIGAQAYGAASYASYVLNPNVTLNARAEVWRDDRGYFAAAFPGNLDFVRAIGGYPSNAFGGGPGTFAELTVGAIWKPSLDGPVAMVVRPEIRYDRAFEVRAYNSGRDRDAFTFATDVAFKY